MDMNLSLVIDYRRVSGIDFQINKQLQHIHGLFNNRILKTFISTYKTVVYNINKYHDRFFGSYFIWLHLRMTMNHEQEN